MNKGSKTDWRRLASMEDQDIDTSDIPELEDDFFHYAQINNLPKKRINKFLRHYIKSQQPNR
jgi:hypothetical protein